MFRRSRVPLTEIRAKRIAFIKPSALGDVVHALPVLHALRQRFPEAVITWVINKSYEPLVAAHPDLDETLAVDRQQMKRGLTPALVAINALARQLRRRRFDLAIDLQGLLRSGLMMAATGAPRRVGLASAREGSRHFCTDLIPMPLGIDEHAVDRNWRVAEAFGVGHLDKRFDLTIDANAKEWAYEQLRELPRPWIALGVGGALADQTLASCQFRRLGPASAGSLWGHDLFRRRGGRKASIPGSHREAQRPLSRFHGKHHAAAIDGPTGESRRDGLQRHRAIAHGRCFGPAGCCSLYLHQSQSPWPLWRLAGRH